MNFKEMTAPCGLDCFNCPIQENNITDNMRIKLSQSTGKKPEDAACKGCRISGGQNLPMIKSCQTYNCVKNKQLDFCFKCKDFPCDKYNPCKSKADTLPHNLKVYNLCKIQNIGLEKWAQESMTIRENYYSGEMILGVGPVIPEKSY